MKMRGERNDGKPRGRSTAYAYFVQHCRAEHKKNHPNENVVFAEFSRQCAERWKNMSEHDKKRFHDLASNDKVRYDEEMKHYVPPKGTKKGKRRSKDPNAPKRALSAFFWFCHDERPAVRSMNPDLKVGDIAKELGRRWADVSPDTKRKYEAMADRDKARYEREMEVYKEHGKQGAGRGRMGHAPPQEEEYDDDDDDEGDDE